MAEAQKRRTHCPNGHPYDDTNTRRSRGKRYCNQCQLERMRRKRADPNFRRIQTEKMRQWRAAHRDRSRQNWRENRKGKKAWLVSYKANHACIFCGEVHPACLDFHHRNPAEKAGLISVAVSRWSLSHIQAEVAKCDIVCANCHRKLHWKAPKV